MAETKRTEMMTKRSPHWQRAVEFDMEGTQYCGIPTDTSKPPTDASIAAFTAKMEAATQAFIKAQREYELAWQEEDQSAQLLFEYAAFCGCICQGGLYMNLTDDGLRRTCSTRYFELIAEGREKYPENKHLAFLEKYIGYHFFFADEPMSEEENLKYVDPDDPGDIPHFYLYLTAGYKRYLDNARLVHAKCCKELTLFHHNVKSVLDSAFLSDSKIGLIHNPNSKYDYLYVVLRRDTFHAIREGSESFLNVAINGIGAFPTLDEAERIADRLNSLIKHRKEHSHDEIMRTDMDFVVNAVRIKKGLLKEELLPE